MKKRKLFIMAKPKQTKTAGVLAIANTNTRCLMVMRCGLNDGFSASEMVKRVFGVPMFYPNQLLVTGIKISFSRY